jgi:hypothetical protein
MLQNFRKLEVILASNAIFSPNFQAKHFKNNRSHVTISFLVFENVSTMRKSEMKKTKAQKWIRLFFQLLKSKSREGHF